MNLPDTTGNRLSDSSIISKKLLIVEGKDEINFFSSLLSWMNIPDVQILSFDGKNNYRNRIHLLKKLPEFPELESVLITRDLDNQNPDDVFKSLCGMFDKIGLSPPQSIGEFGKGNPKTGIFLLPDNNNPGALEYLFIHSVRDSNKFICVEEFMNCYNQNGGWLLSDKAITQIYLASCAPLTSSLGMASMKHIIDFNKPAFQQLRQYLSDFFS